MSREGNNMFPAGTSMVHLKNSSQCSIAQNRLNSFFPGMINMEGTNNEHLIASNHFWRQSGAELAYDGGVGRDELYGEVFLLGSNNMVSGNHFSYDVPASRITPSSSTTPTMILVKSGAGNFLSNNHFVSGVTVNSVVLDGSTTGSKILDSGERIEIFDYTVPHGDGTLRGWRSVARRDVTFPSPYPFFIDYPNNGDRLARWQAAYDRVGHTSAPIGFSELTISGSPDEVTAWLGPHDLPLRFVPGDEGLVEARISTEAGEVVIP